MVELRNGKQADQAGIHQQPAHPQTYYNHADAKRKDSLAYEHENSLGDGQQSVSNVDVGDDLPRILEEIVEEERRLEDERQEKQQEQEQKGELEEGSEGHQPLGQLSLPRKQDYRESEQSIPKKRAHSDIALLNFDDEDGDYDELQEGDEGKDEPRGEQPSADVDKKSGSEQKQDQNREPQGEGKMFAQGGGPSVGAHSKQNDAPIQPPDRRPTPGRINNPRAVNEEGAAPIPSRGVVEEFPWKTDPNYSNRSYQWLDEHGVYHDDEDAPQGPPKKKGRYKNPDRIKWEEEQPMVDPNDMFHDIHLCAARGPQGPPTYDRTGYLLDYEKCLEYTRPYMPSKSAVVNGMQRRVDKAKKEEKEMAQLFFESGAAPDTDDPGNNASSVDHWRDRVSKDLGVPLHNVEVAKFEEWDRKGFTKAKKHEYKKFDQVEKERMDALLLGGAYRVGRRE